MNAMRVGSGNGDVCGVEETSEKGMLALLSHLRDCAVLRSGRTLAELRGPAYRGSGCQVFLKGHLVNGTKRNVLFNLQSLKHDPSNVKPRVFRNLEQTQFGNTKALLHLVQG